MDYETDYTYILETSNNICRTFVVMIVWQFDLQLPMQSVPISH